jgi:hypothetical protein
VTVATSDRLVRLPLWLGMEEHQDRIIDLVRAALAPTIRRQRELVALAR